MDTKLIVIIILVLGGVIGFWALLYPKFVEFQSIRDEIELNEQRKEEVQSRVASIVAEIDKYENLAESDLTLLDKALPGDVDLANLYFYINSLVSSSGLITDNIVIGGGTKFSAEDEDESLSQNDFYKTSVTILAKGSYASLKSFLQKSENSLRIMDVGSVVFSSQASQAGATQLSITINADLYYKPY